MYRIRNTINYIDKCTIIIFVLFILLQIKKSETRFSIGSQIKKYLIFL